MTTFNSNDIYVFPCDRPGVSRLASEYNFTHLSGRVSDKASYVIGEVQTTTEGTVILQVVLDGYYFEIKTKDTDPLKPEFLYAKKLILWLETLSESDSDSANDWAHVTRRVCGVQYENSEGSAGAWTKLQDLDNKLTGKFSALYAVDDTSNLGSIEDGLTYICLDLKDETNWLKSINFKGPQGDPGKDGYTPVKGVDYFDGAKGETGNGISEINLTKTEGNVDFYTITFTDGSNPFEFKVTNGVNGGVGDPGAAGENGLTPVIGENGNWWIGERDTGTQAQGPSGISPQLRIEDNYWHISKDNGITWESLDVEATGKDGLTTSIQIGKNVPYTHDNGIIKLPEITYDFELTATGTGISITRQSIREGEEEAQTDTVDLDLDVYSKTEVNTEVQKAISDLVKDSGIYAIAFDANGGTGYIAPVIYIQNISQLPADLPSGASFTPPAEDKKFHAWGLKIQAGTEGEDKISEITNESEITGNTIVYAMWADNTET